MTDTFQVHNGIAASRGGWKLELEAASSRRRRDMLFAFFQFRYQLFALPNSGGLGRIIFVLANKRFFLLC
jgi:hypothetical protein